MGKIHVMSAELVGRIAAGEVVERPASVVKELMENAIDAGAGSIRVHVEGGGRQLIQVIDDGCGMDQQDALLCLETHATSKITQTGDVGQISTLGFRGEAIPSIASVSRFSMQTRRREDAAGTEVTVDFGAIRNVSPCGCGYGTNIRVSQLFANLPARRKFLRGPETEDGYIEEMVRAVALSRPDISVLLTLNKREVLRAPAAADIGQRICSVLGREAFQTMIPVSGREGQLSVSGYVTKPGYTRSTRREQRIFINGRSATADAVYYAIRDAFEQMVVRGRYPGVVLFLEVPPDAVDVNVHPTKREVRFRSPQEIQQLVTTAIRQALAGVSSLDSGIQVPPGYVYPSQTGCQRTSMAGAGENLSCAREKPVFPESPSNLQTACSPATNGIAKPESPEYSGQEPPEVPASAIPEANSLSAPEVSQAPLLQTELSFASPAQKSALEMARELLAKEEVSHGENAEVSCRKNRRGQQLFRMLGRLGPRYVLAENEAGLVVVHLRAAHQRVLFERFLHSLKGKAAQQPLLLATTIHLGPEDAKYLRQQLEHFQQLGFQIEPFGGNSFVITAVPAAFPDRDLAEMLREILDELRVCSVTNRQSAVHLAQVASRHAMREDQNLTDEEVTALLSELSRADMPYTDPWGRPTMILYSFSELDRRFR